MNGEEDMKDISRQFATLLLACLATLWAALASADGLERIRSSGTINFGYMPDAAPFSGQQGQQVDGYSVELCRQLAGKLKEQLGIGELQMRFQPVQYDRWTQAVKAGQIDLFCTPAAETASMRQEVSFSVPVYTAGLGVLVSEDAPATLLAVLNGEVAHSGPTWRATINRGLANHTFAVVDRGVTEAWVREKLNLLGVIATVITVETYEEGVQLVLDGKADAFFSERMLLKQYVEKLPGGDTLQVLDRVFDFVPVGLALARGDEDLRLQVDVALSELYRSGAVARVYREYLGEPGDTASLLFKVYPLPKDR